MKRFFFFTAIFLLIYYIAAIYNQADWDLWHRLAAGKLFFSAGSVPKVDIFAYTPTNDIWIDHEWGSGAVFYFIADKFGEWGLGLLKILMLFLTFLPVFLMNKTKSGGKENYRIIFYFIFLYSILFGFIDTIRSQSFTLAFFAIWIYLLELVKRGNNRLLFVFPLMTLLWANLHGGFLAGLGILLLYGIGEVFNRKNPAKYFITAFVSGLLTLINPYGAAYWNYLWGAVTLQRVFITEWQQLNLFEQPFLFALGFKVFLLITLIALPYVFLKKSREINWGEVLILIVTCYLSLRHVRHNVLFVIAAAAYMQEYFYSAVKYYFSFLPEKIKSFREHVIVYRLNFLKEAVIYTLIIFIGILTVIFVPLKLEVSEERYPVKSVEFIKKNDLSGNLLVLFNWGSYAMWNLYPQCLVAIDSRYEEVYSNDLVLESARFHFVGKDWSDFMKNYKADLILIDKTYPVFGELLSLNDWKIVHQDKISAVFVPIENRREKWILPEDSVTREKDFFESDIAEKTD